MILKVGIWGLVCAVIGLSAAQRVVSADTLTQIQASVHFEKRATIVPRMECIESRCPHSQAYWAVVFESEQLPRLKYEINQPFGVGRQRAPEAVELTGIVLRAGSRVSVIALAHPISESLSILTEIRSIVPLSHRLVPVESAAALSAPSHAPSLPSSEEWSCQGPESRGYQLLAQVSPVQAQQSVSRYRMHVFAKKMDAQNRLYEVARIQRIRSGTQGDFLVYEGETRDTAAELSISRDDRLNHFPAYLKLSRNQPTPKALLGFAGLNDYLENELDEPNAEEVTPFQCVRARIP